MVATVSIIYFLLIRLLGASRGGRLVTVVRSQTPFLDELEYTFSENAKRPLDLPGT